MRRISGHVSEPRRKKEAKLLALALVAEGDEDFAARMLRLIGASREMQWSSNCLRVLRNRYMFFRRTRRTFYRES